MSHSKEGDKKLLLFVVFLSMFFVTSTITLPIFKPTSTNDHNIYEKSTDPNSNDISLVNTTLILLVNHTQILTGEVYSVEIGQHLNITVFFKDNNSIPLNGATINITKGGFTYNLSEDIIKNQYSIILNTTEIGIILLTIFARLAGYEPQFIPFIVEVIEKFTSIHIFFNGLNVTLDPRIDITIGAVLNITVKYLDINNQHVPGATIQLFGDISGVLSESPSFNQYSYLLDSTQLDIGVRLSTLIASKINYQLQIDDVRISVHRIKTNISGNSIIAIMAGEVIHIEVELTDLDFGGSILDATVMYTWQFGQGNLIDIDSDGIYEINLTSYSVGTYILEITAYKGDNYDFQSFQITIIISNPFSVFILSSSADIPDSDGNFYLLWISSGHANNYSIYVSNTNITQINSSVILLGVQTNNSLYLISELPDGIYYFVVVAFNEYGNFSSNCISVEVKLFPPGVFMLSSDTNNPDLDGVFNLTWTSSEYANHYLIYLSNSFITQINSSVLLLGVQTNNSPYLISGLPDGTYYYVVVAFNEFRNFSSNCIQVIVSRNVDEALIPGYNLFILISIIPIFSVIIIQKQLRNKIREKKHRDL